MDVRFVPLGDYRHRDGAVVVIDVLRAYTTASVAFAGGAREIWLVETVEEALALREQHPGVLVMGEVGGLPVEEFDLPNSPAALARADVAGRILVHRTSAGTKGAVRARDADLLVGASFACAGATARLLADRRPARVTMLLTGADAERDGDEDRACADYLAALLRGEDPDPEPYVRRVPTSTAGRLFADPTLDDYPGEDLEMAMEVDRFDRAMLIRRRDGLLSMRPVDPSDAA